MERAGTEDGLTFRIGIIGARSEQVSGQISTYNETVAVSLLDAVPDVFELDTIDAIVIADPAPAEVYTSIREDNPYQPIVIIGSQSSETAARDDDYLGVVDYEGDTLPVALVISRARQLAKLPRTGTSSERAGVDSTTPIHLERRNEFIALWGLATIAYGVGDTVTTIIGVDGAGLQESNPLVALALDLGGYGGFAALKIAVFGVLLGIAVYHSHRRDYRHYYWPPLVLIFLGTTLTVWNIAILY